MKLIIATRNRHKIVEIREILGVPPGHLASALDFPDLPDVVEDGDTFEANAVKKAVTIARQTGQWALADDSGLEVDALGGAPGVYSARYAGEPVSYPANNEKLLRELQGTSDRAARFRCVIALAGPDGSVRTVEGRCEGRIVDAPRGDSGFGYDPVFVPDGHAMTFAEMPAEEKNGISHRGRALQRARAEWGSHWQSWLGLEPEPARGWTADSLLETMRGFQAPSVLATAVDLGIFPALARRPMTLAEAAALAQSPERGMAIVLDALAAIGLLRKADGRYEVATGAAALLDEGVPGSVLGMLRHQANCLRRWAELPWIVRGGRLVERRPSLRGAEADQASFIEAMDNVSAPVAERVVGDVDTEPFNLLADLGGASGTWTLAWLRRRPAARAVIFDLPPVIPMARERVAAAPEAGRIDFAAGNYLLDDLPSGADLVWISAIVHQHSREENRGLFRRAARTAAGGARLLIRDIVMDETRTKPAAGALFAVNMLAGTERGGTWTLEELREDLEAAGWTAVRQVRFDPGMNAVVEARRAGGE